MANLLNLKELNFRGNCLGPKTFDYMRDLFKTGTFVNVKIINLSENELGDGN